MWKIIATGLWSLIGPTILQIAATEELPGLRKWMEDHKWPQPVVDFLVGIVTSLLGKLGQIHSDPNIDPSTKPELMLSAVNEHLQQAAIKLNDHLNNSVVPEASEPKGLQ
jgi:hypothetical protein